MFKAFLTITVSAFISWYSYTALQNQYLLLSTLSYKKYVNNYEDVTCSVVLQVPMEYFYILQKEIVSSDGR
jgi:hypothetical protein